MADRIVSWGGFDSKSTSGMGVTGSFSVSGSMTTNADIFLYSTSSRVSNVRFFGEYGANGQSSYHNLAVDSNNDFVWTAFRGGNYETTPLTLSGGSSWLIPGGMKIGSITAASISSNGSYTGQYATLTLTGGGYNDATNPSINFITWDAGNQASRFQIHSRTNGGGNGKIVAVPDNGNFIIGSSTDLSAKLAVRGSGTTSSTTSLLVQNANASASFSVLDNGTVAVGNTVDTGYRVNISGSMYLTNGFVSDSSTVVVNKYSNGGTLMTIAGFNHYNSLGLNVSNAVGITTTSGLGVSGNNNIGVGIVASGYQGGLGFALGAILRRALIAKNSGTTGISMYSAAALQIDGTDGGLLLPSLTTAQRNSLTAITSFSILTSGSGYTNGTYQNQSYISLIGGSGSLGRARVVVSGGSVTSVTPDTFWGNGGYGLGYQVGDIVSGSITGGSGWTSQVTGVMVPPGLTVYNTDKKTIEVYNSSSWQPLVTEQYSGSISLTGSLTISGSNAAVTMPSRPAFRVTGFGTMTNLTTTQNGDGTLNQNNWAVDYQQGSALTGSTGVFTAPLAGLYQISLVGRNSGYSSGISQLAVVKYSGASSAVQIMVEWASSSTMNHTGGSSITYMNVGDTLKLKVLAGEINFDGNDNWSVAYIG